MGLLPDTQNCELRMRRECRERFPRRRLQRRPKVSDPGVHHGTCVTHVPWCMSGSLTRSGGMVWYGMVWYGMVWYGMVCLQCCSMWKMYGSCAMLQYLRKVTTYYRGVDTSHGTRFITWLAVHCFSSVHCTQCIVQIQCTRESRRLRSPPPFLVNTVNRYFVT